MFRGGKIVSSKEEITVTNEDYSIYKIPYDAEKAIQFFKNALLNIPAEYRSTAKFLFHTGIGYGYEELADRERKLDRDRAREVVLLKQLQEKYPGEV